MASLLIHIGCFENINLHSIHIKVGGVLFGIKILLFDILYL